MVIQTKHFGEREIDEANVLLFEEGIFGFDDLSKYVILSDGEGGNFCWLQSLEDTSVALPLIDPVAFYKDYNPEIAADYVAKIGELKEEDLNLFAVVVVPEAIEKMTVNLKAPILINVKTKKGIQVIVEDEEYGIRHNLYEQIQKLKGAGE